MEVATVPTDTAQQDTSQDAPPPEAQAPEQPPGQAPVEELFRFSAFIHVGPGASECAGIERQEDGTVVQVKCQDESHVHAWCRLPNQFQQSDIVDKAQAAKARRIRALKDPASDARAVLDLEMSELRSLGEQAREPIVEEIVRREFNTDMLEAFRDVQEQEEFAHIDQDREELRRLEDTPEDERNEEEYTRLAAHSEAYSTAVKKNLKERQDPKRAALSDRPLDELLNIVERDRIERMGTDKYLDEYAFWSWYVGTMKPILGPGRRFTEKMYSDPSELKRESPEVVDALTRVYNSLDSAFGRGGGLKNG